MSSIQLLVLAKTQEEAIAKCGKIVGLKESRNGRSCVSYHCCREVAILDELVQFKLSVANIDKKIEVAIQAVHIQDGTASGTIGFLSQNIIQLEKNNLWESLLKSLSCMINWKVKLKEEKVIFTEVLHHSNCRTIILKKNRGVYCRYKFFSLNNHSSINAY